VSIPGSARTRVACGAAVGLAAALVWLAPGRAAGADRPNFVFGHSPEIFQQHPDDVVTRVGLWLDGSWVDNDKQSGSLDLNHVNVLVDSRWKNLQGFVEAEYEHEAGRDGGTTEDEFELEQAYVRFRPRDELSLRAGRFNTPAGIWLPIHWSILMDTIEKPPHITKNLLPEQQLGAEVAGTVFPDWLRRFDGHFDYSLFVGGSSDRLGQGDVDGVTGGGDLRLRLDERYLIGATAYSQRNDIFDDRWEYDLLLYGEATLPWALTFRTEYLHQQRQRPDDAPWSRTLDVGYAKLRWDFARWFYANYRVSYGDDDDPAGNTNRQLINTFTLGVQPIPAVRVKLEYSIHDLSGHGTEDFQFWGASVGACF
jgi:hypothetical protein